MRLDPPSDSVNSAKLERQLKYCDGMIAVVTNRQEGPSPNILYEISLCIRARKPLLVFMEDSLKNGLIPYWILQNRFSRKSYLRQIREHQTFVKFMKAYLGDACPPRYQSHLRKKTCALVGTMDLPVTLKQVIDKTISTHGYSPIKLDNFPTPFQNQKIYNILSSVDASICIINSKSLEAQYLIGAMQFIFIPSILLTTESSLNKNSRVPEEYRPLYINIARIDEMERIINKQITMCEQDFVDIDDPENVKKYVQQLLKFKSPIGKYGEDVRGNITKALSK